jgi:hypothetical protein
MASSFSSAYAARTPAISLMTAKAYMSAVRLVRRTLPTTSALGRPQPVDPAKTHPTTHRAPDRLPAPLPTKDVGWHQRELH